MSKLNNQEYQEFYLATRDRFDYLVYHSELFKFSEIDIINLIKICLIEARSKAIGKKILAIYRDATEHRQNLTKERLKSIGIEEPKNPEYTKERNPVLK